MAGKNYFAHASAIVDDGCQIAYGVKIWHFSHLMTGCRIGEDCVIGQNVFIGSKVVLGRNVHVQNNVSIYDGVECEDDVFLGPSMVFTNVINPRSAVSRKAEFKRTIVRRGASIGANATIICGNEIGEFAFVGAGAVVSKPVLPYQVVAGNPACHIGWMSEQGHRLNFDAEGNAICPANGDAYMLSGNHVSRISSL
jgi:UDP-2-acetamido-3-amino-2,3-dideoxy-glucuronate N-acetyltransferase